jgi:hypothetical protein
MKAAFIFTIPLAAEGVVVAWVVVVGEAVVLDTVDCVVEEVVGITVVDGVLVGVVVGIVVGVVVGIVVGVVVGIVVGVVSTVGDEGSVADGSANQFPISS